MIRIINRDELRKKLQESPGRVILLDVRDRQHFEAEHIKGAISVPLSELLMRAKKEFGKEQEIIVYCDAFECPLSAQAVELLDKKGYQKPTRYEGGLKDWKTAGFPTEVADRARAA